MSITQDTRYKLIERYKRICQDETPCQSLSDDMLQIIDDNTLQIINNNIKNQSQLEKCINARQKAQNQYPISGTVEFENLNKKKQLDIVNHIRRIDILNQYVNECQTINEKTKPLIYSKLNETPIKLTTDKKLSIHGGLGSIAIPNDTITKKKSVRRKVTEEEYDTFVKNIMENDIDYVKSMLEDGMDPNAYDRLGLCYAMQHPDHVIANMLLDYGANTQINSKECPLYVLALQRNDVDLAKRMLQHGLEIYYDDNDINQDPLMLTLFMGNLELIDGIIKAGANLNHHYGKLGLTPVMIAICNRYDYMLKILFDYRVKLTVKDYRQKNPMKWAKICENEFFFELMEMYGRT